MAIGLYIGYTGEGNTDKRFLSEIIFNTFTDVAMDCPKDINIEDLVWIKVEKRPFVDMMVEASGEAARTGLSIFCIHADADKKSLSEVMRDKFLPLYRKLEHESDQVYCKTIVTVIPITETEAWMLADKELLKEKINAKDKTEVELGIEKHPESYTDPKMVIMNAIRIAQQGKTKRRRKDLSIADLYEELGQAIPIAKLRTIPSFCDFERSVRDAFKSLGYLRP